MTAHGKTVAAAAIDISETGDRSDLPWPFLLTVFSDRSVADGTAGTGRESLGDIPPRELRGGYYFDIGLVLGGLQSV